MIPEHRIEMSGGPIAFSHPSIRTVQVCCLLKLFFGDMQGRVPGRTGVWVGDAKIGAIGVKIGNGITSHGLAVNVNNDLSPFRNIIPCGISDKVVTSLLIETGSSQVTPEFFGKHLVSSFVSQFQYEAVRILAEDELLRT